MTVRVANDFKTETQVAYENLVMDNKAQRDKIRNLEQEIIKLNKGKFNQNKNLFLKYCGLFHSSVFGTLQEFFGASKNSQ